MKAATSRSPKILYGLLGLAVLVWLFSQWNSDERRIARRLETLRSVVEKSAGEGDLEAVHRARQLGGLFAQTFSVEGEPFGVLTDRRRLGQLLVQYRRRTESVGVGFSDQKLQVLGAGGRKAVEMELVATLTGRTGTDFRRESYRLFFLWVEEDGEWAIERLELLEVLAGNPLF